MQSSEHTSLYFGNLHATFDCSRRKSLREVEERVAELRDEEEKIGSVSVEKEICNNYKKLTNKELDNSIELTECYNGKIQDYYIGKLKDKMLKEKDILMMIKKGNLYLGGRCALRSDGYFIAIIYTD